jgi:adenylate cyclase
MGVEIERKFLVDKEKWAAFNKPEGNYYRQGYLLGSPEKTIRVRLTKDQAFLTIKGISTGAVRQEFEYEIPQADAVELLDGFAANELAKVRYKIMYSGKLWEVDVFENLNTGLIVAEVELENENESVDIPEWIAEEVTGIEKYYNSNLSITPYSEW